MNSITDIRVLLVEDEYINAWALANALRPYCNVRHAATKEAVLYWMVREKFHLVLLDIHLGFHREAGIELLPEIKSIQPSCRVFATTGYGSAADENRFLGMGFDAFFPKPVDEQKILDEIENFRNRARVA